MPHCVIEYSSEIASRTDPSRIVEIVYQGALASNLFESSDIKTRAVAYDYFQSGSEKANFIHVGIHIFSGRTEEQKKNLASSVLDELKCLDIFPASVSVEIIDIDKDSYAKYTE